MDFIEKFLASYHKTKNLFTDEIPSFTQIYHREGNLLAESFNTVESKLNSTLHSEFQAIEIATKKLKEKYLPDTILLTALEPCLQCAGSIIRVKIPEIFYFLPAKKGEGITSYATESIYLLNHFPKLTLVENSQIKADFKEFFKEKR